MTGLNWEKANQSNPDPARVQREHIGPQLSDREIAAFKARMASIINAPPSKIPRKALVEVIKGSRQHSLSIVDRVDVVLRSGRKDSDKFIHETAMMIVSHASQYGDCSAALALVLAMPVNSRRERLQNGF